MQGSSLDGTEMATLVGYVRWAGVWEVRSVEESWPKLRALWLFPFFTRAIGRHEDRS